MKINTDHLGVAVALSGFSFGGAEFAAAQDHSPILHSVQLTKREHKLTPEEMEKIDATYFDFSALVGVGFTWGALRHLSKKDKLPTSPNTAR